MAKIRKKTEYAARITKKNFSSFINSIFQKKRYIFAKNIQRSSSPYPMDYTTEYATPLGDITMASDGEFLTGLWFNGQKYFADTLDSIHEECDGLPVFNDTRRWLDIYFSGKKPDFTPPLLMRTSTFRKKVWEALLSIPYGQTTTYGEIAKSLGCRSAQAVGGAVGHNAISLIIPCHRVIGVDRNPTGYAGGIERKQYLLQLEKSVNNTYSNQE